MIIVIGSSNRNDRKIPLLLSSFYDDLNEHSLLLAMQSV